MNKINTSLFILILMSTLFPASDVHHIHLDGSTLGMIWFVPFAGILLSIALFPLISEKFWHHNYGKISLFWAFIFFVSFISSFGFETTFFYAIEVYLKEFLPFIVLLLALFTVSGGVYIESNLKGTPLVNVGILTLGTILASWMGTTGASMLLIRPLIRSNQHRKHKVHLIIFFIFLVSNIGGSLTPLGDPPLFLGFLNGIDFFWTTKNMLYPMILASVALIVLFYFIDLYFLRKERIDSYKNDKVSIKMYGTSNLFLLGLVVLVVIVSGVWKSDSSNPQHWAISLYNTCILTYGVLFQVISLLIITFISLKITPNDLRLKNSFSWEPIKEVAKLFATIFITIVPVIEMLKSGLNGPMASLIKMLKNENGDNLNHMYFWLTGILSSFLDNAPTYLVFFNTAGGDPIELMSSLSATLLAISLGAVFMGANTYIGNAPNFMVKAIAEENKINMPSFFGYMVWSFFILMPIFFIVSIIIF